MKSFDYDGRGPGCNCRYLALIYCHTLCTDDITQERDLIDVELSFVDA